VLRIQEARGDRSSLYYYREEKREDGCLWEEISKVFFPFPLSLIITSFLCDFPPLPYLFWGIFKK
jgi:hypothetical protein